MPVFEDRVLVPAFAAFVALADLRGVLARDVPLAFGFALPLDMILHFV
jgi:hypothetical protein